MLRSCRVLLSIPATLLVVAVFTFPVLAANWVDIPGRIVFDADDGSVRNLPFSSWATNKSTFVPTARGNDARLAGHFACTSHSEHTVMRVTDANSFTLQGDMNPVIVTFPDGRELEVEVVNSFIWAIARMDSFFFKSFDEELGKTVTYEVPSEAVQRLYFHE